MSVAIDDNLEEQRPQKLTLCQSFRRDAHIKCLILTLLILGCLAALAWCRMAEVTRVVVNFHSFPITTRRKVSPCDEGYVYIPIAFMVMLYLVYLVECWHCSTRLELTYNVDATSVYEHIQQMRDSQPMIWWKAICYHYVRRSRQVTRYRNGDAYTTTQIYFERVNSHASGSCFTYATCGVKDISKKLVDLEKHPATKIRFSKGFAFANIEAANEFEEQRMRFFLEHERIDDYMEMREGLDLVGVNFQEYMVAFADPDRLPWYVSHYVFWVFSMLLLSWPLRVVIEFKTAYVHYQVTKLFGVNYLTPASGNRVPDRLSRGSTVDSSEIEHLISNNFTLAPSYSEALLLDTSRGSPIVRRDTNGNIPNGVCPTDSILASRDSLADNYGTLSTNHNNNNNNRRPRSISRTSLHNGQVIFLVSPLTPDVISCPIAFQQQQEDGPPTYEDALRICRPLLPLRRSLTERNFQRPTCPLARLQGRSLSAGMNVSETAL